MGEIPFTFETMPQALKYIVEKLDALEKKVDAFQGEKKEVMNEWMNVKDLCAYLPSHPAEQTVYGWTSGHQIPFHKKGKGICFVHLKSKIGFHQAKHESLSENWRQKLKHLLTLKEE